MNDNCVNAPTKTISHDMACIIRIKALEFAICIKY